MQSSLKPITERIWSAFSLPLCSRFPALIPLFDCQLTDNADQVRKLHRSGLSKFEIAHRLNIGRAPCVVS